MLFARSFHLIAVLFVTFARYASSTPIAHHPEGEHCKSLQVQDMSRSLTKNAAVAGRSVDVLGGGVVDLATLLNNQAIFGQQANGFFDFFGGINNFDGGLNQILVQQAGGACQAQQLNLIQQQLAIVQEFTKQ